ncbi:hypothetical protein JYB87_09890 [Shewanella avicenniae]|uniref:Uncharacterized protein n=1 Tax=Shewanella avicenniae TaxID=2814294 RepID=A0ABX7QKX0_9GAMM|nr:hypothetical protein [Shewanella avicenniae]QSX32099.1 hypothetical protein JYB87_09890 [Shewanella avicenniae]
MSYGGSEDWKYIDKVLLFLNLSDAFNIEQSLHSCLDSKKAFGRFSASKDFPLCKNGQSELYIEDVLTLDSEYSEQQKQETLYKIKDKRLSILGKTHEQERREAMIQNIVFCILILLFAPIGFVIRMIFSKLEGADLKEEAADFFDRITGGKKLAAREASQLKVNLEEIMSRIRTELNN